MAHCGSCTTVCMPTKANVCTAGACRCGEAAQCSTTCAQNFFSGAWECSLF
jgi:hypothetical protein